MAVDGGCGRDVVHRMNEEYRAWGAVKNVLNNRGLGINAQKCLYLDTWILGVVSKQLRTFTLYGFK